jgi:septal ring factor EnvC (AmiA/AmiB activator)
MTEKELHKLSRQDLLHLLLTEVKENGTLQGQLDETRSELRDTQESNDRLKARINDREEQVQRLKEKLDKKDRLLDKKDAYISELETKLETLNDGEYAGTGSFGSLAEASLQLNGVFEAAQTAADQYINSIKAMYEKMASTRKIPENVGENAETLETAEHKEQHTSAGKVTEIPHRPEDTEEELEEIALDHSSIVDLDEEEKKAAEKAAEEAKQAAFDEDWAKIESERKLAN